MTTEHEILTRKYQSLLKAVAELIAVLMATADGNYPDALYRALARLQLEYNAQRVTVTAMRDMSLRVNPDPVKLAELTLAELIDLQHHWLKQAEQERLHNTFYVIAENLENISRDPDSHIWLHDQSELKISVYRASLQVYLGERIVYGDLGDDRVFIPGEWLKVIDEVKDKAYEAMNQKKNAAEEERRQALIKELTF